MKMNTILAFLLAIPTASGLAAEQYQCTLVNDEGNGQYRKDDSQNVTLTMDKDAISSRIHINSASRDMTFAKCHETRNDGSNFRKWFAWECKQFASADGSPYTVDAFIYGAYAGISPPVVAGYAMHDTLAGAGAQLGIGTPERTFVIYADRKPQYEFFCYSRQPQP